MNASTPERCECTMRQGSTRTRPPHCLDCGLEIALVRVEEPAEELCDCVPCETQWSRPCPRCGRIGVAFGGGMHPVPVGDETEALRAALKALQNFIDDGCYSGSGAVPQAIHDAAEKALARVAGLEDREASLRKALAPFVERPRWLSIGSYHNTAEIRVPAATVERARAALADSGEAGS